MFKKIEVELNAIEERIKNVANEDTNARNAYYESVRNRKKGVTQKLGELQGELKAVKAILEVKVQSLSEALGDGNVEEAVAIEEEIDAANNTIAELDYKISLLNNTEPKGDKELYLAAIGAFKGKFPVIQEEVGKIPAIQNRLGEIRVELEKKEKSLERVEGLIRRLNHHGSSSDKAELIAMVEAFEGEIDVLGHNAGKDDEAKIRYIRGNSRGIENTAAGQKLKANEGI